MRPKGKRKRYLGADRPKPPETFHVEQKDHVAMILIGAALLLIGSFTIWVFLS